MSVDREEATVNGAGTQISDNVIENGATLIQVQIALGHSDPKTTARYIGADLPDDDTAVDYVRY